MIGRKKPLPPAMPAFELKVPKAEGRLREACEALAGRGKIPYNVSGCLLSAEVAIVRTYGPDPYQLMVKFGDEWLCTHHVSDSDRGIKQLGDAIQHVGPSEQELAERRQREAEQQARIDAEEAEKAARAAVHRRRREEANARHREAVAAR